MTEYNKDQNAQSSSDSPAAIKVTIALNLITNWVSMHDRLIERLETQDCFGFTYFARSNAYSTILI